MKAKRGLSVLLATLLCAATISGCSDGGNSSKVSSTDSSKTDLQFNLPGDYNFGGETILIKGFGGMGFQKEGSSDVSDLEIQWKAEVEKKYNCKLELETLIPNDTQSSLVVRILSGDKVADVIACHRLDVEKMRISGDLLLDLSKQTPINLNDDIWNKGLTDTLTYNNFVYGIYPERPDKISVAMFFNKDLLESLNLESPYSLVENKQWNYENFIRYCQAATTGERYGVAFCGDGILTLFHNNGMQLITKQADGKMVYTANNQANIDTITYLKQKLLIEKNMPDELPVTDYHTMFKEGKLLFITGPADYIVTENQWGSCDFEVGFLPIPIGPNGEDYSFLQQQWPDVMCLTSTNSNPERGAAIIQAYAECTRVVNQLRWEDIENRWFGNDSEGFEVYKMLYSKAYYDYAIYDLGLYDLMYLPQKVFRQAETPVAATFEAQDSAMKSLVDDVYNRNMK